MTGEDMSKPNIDVKQDHAQLRVSEAIYSKQTIYAVGYVFLDKAYILLDKDGSDIIVYLYPQQQDADLKQLCLEFSNELLNYAHYFSRAETNAEAVKMIMQRALFSAAPSLVQEAEEKEIEDLIRELEAEEQPEGNADAGAVDKTEG